MCVIYLSYRQRAERPLLILANRDEFYERPTHSAHFWKEIKDNNKADAPDILGGKDLKSGGAWFAVHSDGRWAIITNYRDPKRELSVPSPRSRGLLVKDYLNSKKSPKDFVKAIETFTPRREYQGFSLLLGDREELYFYSNINQKAQKLSAGLYGLSNHLLDSPWPKIVDGKRILAKLLQGPSLASEEVLFSFLQDRSLAKDERLPDTGIGREWERILSARFIVSPDYGTRCSTLFYFDALQKAYFFEQTYGPEGKKESQQKFSFPLKS